MVAGALGSAVALDGPPLHLQHLAGYRGHERPERPGRPHRNGLRWRRGRGLRGSAEPGTGTDLPEEPAAETPIEPDDGQYGADDDQYETEDPTTVSPEADDTVILPDTGGPNPAALALPSLVLLLATGLLAFRVVRRD